MSTPAIRLSGVTKRFGERTAVDRLDLEVPTGKCVGLLGPNGAGKSTTMRMLTAQALPDSGQIEVLGFRMPDESRQARAACGVVPQQDNLDQELTASENLEIFARLHGLGRDERDAAVARALERVALTDRADSPVGALSGGMRRRLLIARGLVHEPSLALLDEPTVGLDPQVRQELWALIDGLRAEGVTILMTTHYIEEAQRLADEVAIMTAGRVIARGRPADLIAEHAGREVVELYGPPHELAGIEREAAEAGVRTRRSGAALAVIGAANGWGERLRGERRAANLEDVYVLLTGDKVE